MERRKRKRGRRINSRFAALCLTAVFLAAGGIIWFLRGGPGAPSPAGVQVPEWVTEDLLTVNEWSRPGTPLERVSGVVIHYVGNPGTTAQANRNYFESLASGAEGIYASSHFVVGLEGEVFQCVPLSEIAYASNSRNDDTVSIEVCHPDETGEFSPVTYDRCVELTAWLCHEFRLDPETDVIRHYDVTGKQCPLYYVEHPEAWDAFRKDVSGALKALEAEKTSAG